MFLCHTRCRSDEQLYPLELRCAVSNRDWWFRYHSQSFRSTWKARRTESEDKRLLEIDMFSKYIGEGWYLLCCCFDYLLKGWREPWDNLRITPSTRDAFASFRAHILVPSWTPDGFSPFLYTFWLTVTSQHFSATGTFLVLPFLLSQNCVAAWIMFSTSSERVR